MLLALKSISLPRALHINEVVYVITSLGLV